jgi:hypothetical protein
MQCTCAVIYRHLWSVQPYHIFADYLINGAIFEKKKRLNLKCVFLFSLRLLPETWKNWAKCYDTLTEVFLKLAEVFPTLTEVFPWFFLNCKANARVKLAKMGHDPHSFTLVVIYAIQLLFVLFYVLFVCKCVLQPDDNPVAVNKYIKDTYT